MPSPLRYPNHGVELPATTDEEREALEAKTPLTEDDEPELFAQLFGPQGGEERGR